MKNGLCAFSCAIVDGGPWPGMTTVASSSEKSLNCTLRRMSSYPYTSPNTPPTLPANSVSPVKTVERKRYEVEPSVWPGVCSKRMWRRVAEGQLVAVDDRQGAVRERADRFGVGFVHDDLRVGKRARDVGGRIAMIGVFVRDQDVPQMVRPFSDGVEDRLRMTGGIDQRRRPAVFEEEEVAVGRMRVVRMMAHVVGVRIVGMPAPRGRVGELPRIEAQDLGERPGLVVGRRAVARGPRADRRFGEPGRAGQLRGPDPGAALGLAQDVAKIVLELHSALDFGQTGFDHAG